MTEEPQTPHALWHTLRLTQNDAEGIPFIRRRDALLHEELLSACKLAVAAMGNMNAANVVRDAIAKAEGKP